MRKLGYTALSFLTVFAASDAAAESLKNSLPIYASCYHFEPNNHELVTLIFQVGRGSLVDELFEHAGESTAQGTIGISIHGTPGRGKDLTAQWQNMLLSEGVDPDRVEDAGCAFSLSVEAFLESKRSQLRDHPSRQFDDARFKSWVPGPGLYGNYIAEVWDWDGRKLSVRQLGKSASAENSNPTKVSVSAKPESRLVTMVAKGPTPNELKYEREIQDYNKRLAEIQKIKTDTAAKHASDQAAAERELARHRQEIAAADAAQARYRQELAEHQRQVDAMANAQDKERKVEWREAVVVCALNPNEGQGKFGNWRCDGPLQMTYAKLGSPGVAASPRAMVDVSDACGGKPEAVRDLGLVGTSHLFGCSFGLHPGSASAQDPAARHGITYVPGRAVYRCPKYYSACRTQ